MTAGISPSASRSVQLPGTPMSQPTATTPEDTFVRTAARQKEAAASLAATSWDKVAASARHVASQAQEVAATVASNTINFGLGVVGKVQNAIANMRRGHK